MTLILGCVILVDELKGQVEPVLQLRCTVSGNLGCPNPPATNDIVELRAGPRTIVLLAFGSTTVDVGRQSFQILPDLFAEHGNLRTAFKPVP